jgi:hypothetical protein
MELSLVTLFYTAAICASEKSAPRQIGHRGGEKK